MNVLALLHSARGGCSSSTPGVATARKTLQAIPLLPRKDRSSLASGMDARLARRLMTMWRRPCSFKRTLGKYFARHYQTVLTWFFAFDPYSSPIDRHAAEPPEALSKNSARAGSSPKANGTPFHSHLVMGNVSALQLPLGVGGARRFLLGKIVISVNIKYKRPLPCWISSGLSCTISWHLSSVLFAS